MSPPPPFVLPPDGPRARVRAVLAGAGRQRVAVALLALAALLGAGAVWARATPRLAGPPNGQDAVAPADQTLPRAAPDTGTAGGSAGRSGSSAGAGSSGVAGPSDQVAVHVAGRVRHPGLVRLPAGSRVQDAITAAGGATPGADLDAINLARKLTDGEQVRVPGPGDPAPPPPPDGASGPATPSAPLDLNTATVEQLDTLPGVGEVTAGRIVAYRSAHPFPSGRPASTACTRSDCAAVIHVLGPHGGAATTTAAGSHTHMVTVITPERATAQWRFNRAWRSATGPGSRLVFGPGAPVGVSLLGLGRHW